MSMLSAHRQNRRRARRPMRGPSADTIRNAIWIAVIALALVAAAAYAAYRVRSDRAAERDSTTLCLKHTPSATANLVLVDRTDPLASADSANFTAIMRTIAQGMRRNDRLTLVPFDGDLGRVPTPVLDICSPGSESEADGMQEGRGEARRRFAKEFQQPLDVQASRLMVASSTPRSPIAEQIERIVTHPAVTWTGERRVLTVLTDGLHNTAGSPIYVDGKIKLPPPTRGLLAGVTVRYFLLANAKRSDLQLRQVQEAWREWFEAEGATVEIYAPGFVVTR